MNWLDYGVIVLFLLVMVGIGFYSKNNVKTAEDFYIGGGKIPWWLSGISHHVTGYSGVVFVGYAGIAYALGTAIYFWWAVNIALAVSVGAVVLAPRWPRLRHALGIQSPTEYLRMRYSTAAQVIVAISGIFSKLLDVGAKWASIGILVTGFTGLPLWIGILSSAIVALFYMSVGGLIADLWTDFAQWVVQTLAGLILFFGTMGYISTQLGMNLFQAFQALPAGNITVFDQTQGQGSALWTLFYFVTVFLSYNGGTWSLATRFISVKDAKEAKRSAFLSAALYLIWPLIVFTPMWLGPLTVPGLTQGEASNTLYATISMMFLPHGMIGLSLAAMYANTLSMCTSDCNTISAVLTRDIIPIFKQDVLKEEKKELFYARLTTIMFMAVTVVVGLLNERFGGVTGLILSWFSALLGPTAVPLLLGLFPMFKHCDGKAAIGATLAGFGVFVLTKAGLVTIPPDFGTIAPTIVTFVVFYGVGLYNQYVAKKAVPKEIEELMVRLGQD
ncbi:Na+:solute symporter [Clostridiaceae bacterium]|nr:Na+:solute symporter [Clostridiaceae bacterium]RKI18355.1 Na+:solute symporter [bacterium 1XD21-70]